MGAFTEVEIARRLDRPRPAAYVDRLIQGFVELHGDRVVMDDPGVLTGLGSLRGERVAVIAHRRSAEHPHSGAGGLRKAVRMIELAGRFDLGVITLVDVAGVHPSAQPHGPMWRAVGAAIEALLRTPAPTVAVLCGEGVSGGALALCVTDRLITLRHAFLCATAPESVSAILWRTPDRAAEAAEILRLSAPDLMSIGLATEIVDEGAGAHLVPDDTIERVGDALQRELSVARSLGPAERVSRRRKRFREIASP